MRWCYRIPESNIKVLNAGWLGQLMAILLAEKYLFAAAVKNLVAKNKMWKQKKCFITAMVSAYIIVI